MIIAPSKLTSVSDLNTFTMQLQECIERVVATHSASLFDDQPCVHYVHLQWSAQGLVCTFEHSKPTDGVFLEVPLAASRHTLCTLAQDIQNACAHPFAPQGTTVPVMPMERALECAQEILVQNMIWNHLEEWIERGFFGLLGRSTQQEHARLCTPELVASDVPNTPAAAVRSQSAPGVRTRTAAQPLGL